MDLIPVFRAWSVPLPVHVLDMCLHDAVVYGKSAETIQYFLDAGAHVDEKTAFFSPLMNAARNGRTDVVTLLLRAGANKDESRGGHTAFSLSTDPCVIDSLGKNE
jgi:ankyrin repeat protein